MIESAEVREALLRYLTGRANGDFDYIRRHLSGNDGVLMISNGPMDWLTGHEKVAKTIKANMTNDRQGIQFIADEVLGYSEGTVGWSAAKFRLRLPEGKEMPFRISTVFHREEDEWKLVLSHLSVVG